jgi:hypothetical protein
MARRFFYISLGVLALAIAWNLGAMNARADWDPGGSGCIAGLHWRYVYDYLGRCWHVSESGAWNPEPGLDIPVPAAQVKFFEDMVLVTTTDQVWHHVSTGWELADPFPGCGGTALEKSSWGGIKKQFRK